jgi:hypothetical protein
MSAATRIACLILIFACVNPLITDLTPIPDVSGAEGAFAVIGWVIGIFATQRVTALDGILALLGGWTVTSALLNDVPIAAAALEFALLAAPFTFLRLLAAMTTTDASTMRRTLKFLVVAQLVMFTVQLVAYSDIDSLKGTFAGTQYGAHVSAFIVLVTAAVYALRHPGSWVAKWAVVGGLVAAYLADSKIAIVYFLVVGIVYMVWGAGLPGLRRLNVVSRWALGAVGLTATWLFYTGSFGNIALSGYVERTTETGGGKIAVINQIGNPESRLWTGENFLIGAGPAQTVSRTAGLTVPNSSQKVAPAASLGIPQSRYYTKFERDAAGRGYIPKSSATNAASSGLGVVGDLGVVGAVLYGAAFVSVFRWAGRRLGYRSWPALAWLGLLVPGFLGEWLEFPPACMFLVAVIAYLAVTPSATSSAKTQTSYEAARQPSQLPVSGY